MSDIEAQADKLAKEFMAKSVDLETALHVGVEKCCILVEADAVDLSPVDTGLLKNSITHRVKNVLFGISGEVGTNVEYAAFQEFGTSRQPTPQPFLTPALNRNKARINEILRKELSKGLT